VKGRQRAQNALDSSLPPQKFNLIVSRCKNNPNHIKTETFAVVRFTAAAPCALRQRVSARDVMMRAAAAAACQTRQKFGRASGLK
jgi:hypothetical protein